MSATISSVKNIQLELFYIKKNEPKSGPRQRLFVSPGSASKMPENVCRFFFFFQTSAKNRQIVAKIFQDQ